MKNKKCLVCGKELTGRQKMYCSDKCQIRGYYDNNIEKILFNAREYREKNKLRIKK